MHEDDSHGTDSNAPKSTRPVADTSRDTGLTPDAQAQLDDPKGYIEQSTPPGYAETVEGGDESASPDEVPRGDGADSEAAQATEPSEKTKPSRAQSEAGEKSGETSGAKTTAKTSETSSASSAKRTSGGSNSKA